MKPANLIAVMALGATVGVGCSADGLTVTVTPGDDAGAAADMSRAPDIAVAPGREGGCGSGLPLDCDAGDCEGPPNRCGDVDPCCQDWGVGPDNNKPFPLPTDPMRDPNVAADGVVRNPSGYVVLPTQATSHFVWLAQDQDGTVAKVDTRTMKEVARYRTTTCYSLPTGSKQRCDGTNGCCAADSQPQWRNRKNNMAEGPAQQVQLTNNSPSRTAVDLNGDLFVANRAFGGQASITKIAGELSGCPDRNKNGRIDTSSDVNKDGRIDQNDAKEFLDLDDECVLWTTNHGATSSTGRPLALSPGPEDASPVDAFAGGYETGLLYRIDRNSGKTKDEWQLPQGCHPYGVAIDAQGFGWAPNDGDGPLCYFDTRKNTNVGQARGTMTGYGVSIDRDQNVWVGGGVARYTPDRSKGFAGIGNGYWTRIDGLTGKGIAADSRNPKKYFVWSATTRNNLLRIPASDIPLPKGMDATVALDPNWPKIDVAGYGIGVTMDQNVIAAPQSGVVVRIKVDANGDFVQPDVLNGPKDGELCPAGDRCDLGSHVYTYSDFTGFATRNLLISGGTYAYVVRSGCEDSAKPTQWYIVTWDADVPPNTSLSVHARSGPTDKPDQTWGTWTQDFKAGPADLSSPGTLVPNGPAQTNANYLQVEFALRTNDRAATPKLKAFNVAYKCVE